MLSPEALERVAKTVDAFIGRADVLDAKEAEESLLPILRDLLAHDGFSLKFRVRPESRSTDYVAIGSEGAVARRLGVEYKHYQQRAGKAAVDQIIRIARDAELQPIPHRHIENHITTMARLLHKPEAA